MKKGSAQEPDISCVWSFTWGTPGELCEPPVEFTLKVYSSVLISGASKLCHGSRADALGLEGKLDHTQPGLGKVREGQRPAMEETPEMQLTQVHLGGWIHRDTRLKH